MCSHQAATSLLLTLLLVPLLLLGGCGAPDADAPFRSYQQRLERTLEERADPATAPGQLPRLPRAGQLRQPISADSLGTLDFLDLRGCDLQVTIGKQNSSLGKLARDSQRLLLALEFLRLAPACIDLLAQQGEEELAGTLARAQTLKQQQLPALIFNATLGSTEYAALWRPGQLPADYPANTSSAVINALEGINAASRRWMQGDYQADNLALELHLAEIRLGDAGLLWRALAHQAQWLARADSVLQHRAAQGPLCKPKLRPAAADILPNVVRRFFIEGIQPRAAVLGRRYHQLLPPVQELEQQLAAVLPEAYQNWQTRRDSAMLVLSQAPRQHVHQLQQLLSTCQRRSPSGT